MKKKMETSIMGYIGFNIGVYIGVMEKKMETTIMGYIGFNIGVYIGVMEKTMETTTMGYIGYNIGVYIGVMEKKMETTIMGYIGYNIGVLPKLPKRCLYQDNLVPLNNPKDGTPPIIPSFPSVVMGCHFEGSIFLDCLGCLGSLKVRSNSSIGSGSSSRRSRSKGSRTGAAPDSKKKVRKHVIKQY